MNKLILNEPETQVYTLILNKGPLPATGLEIKKKDFRIHTRTFDNKYIIVY